MESGSQIVLAVCLTALFANNLYMDDIWMIVSHPAGMAWFSVVWNTPYH